MLFELTEKNIDEGIRGRCRNCPVALAIRDRFPCSQVEVYSWEVSIQGILYRLPPALCHAIRRFDTSGVIAPCAFELDIPEGLYG